MSILRRRRKAKTLTMTYREGETTRQVIVHDVTSVMAYINQPPGGRDYLEVRTASGWTTYDLPIRYTWGTWLTEDTP